MKGNSFINKLVIGSILTLGAGTMTASDIISKEEHGVRYRQSAYFMLRMNTGPMAAMMMGKRDYDGELFRKQAERVAMIVNFTGDGFAGEWKADNSDAKADIWQNKDDFDAKMQDLFNAAQDLAKTAQAGDKDANFKAFRNMGKTCKACHDKYKAD